MRSLFLKIAALVRRMRAAVSQVVLVAAQAADGVIRWTWQVLRSGGVDGPVEYTPCELDVPEVASPATDAETLDAGLRLVGEQAIRAASEMLRFDEVRSHDVAADIATWVRSLNRDDLRTVAEADALAAGRHVAGVEPLIGVVGEPIPRPDPAADADRLKKRCAYKERAAADERSMLAAARQRREREMEEELAGLGPSLVPVYR